MWGPLLAHVRVRVPNDDSSEGRAIRCHKVTEHGAHTNPTSGSLITGVERRTSQLRSQIRCIRKLRGFPDEPSEFEVSANSNSLTSLLTRWCLHGVKKARSERRASYPYCNRG